MARKRLPSESVVVSAPMSFSGSAQRIWKITRVNAVLKWALMVWVALFLLFFAWVFVFGWYFIFGLFLVPYRLLRRGSRKRKKAARQHREVLDAIQSTGTQTPPARPSPEPKAWPRP